MARWQRSALAWLAFFVAGGIAFAVSGWAFGSLFWALAGHFAVATLLSTDGDPLGRRLALIAVVGAVGVGLYFGLQERWAHHEWPTATFALFFGWLAYEIAGRLLTPKLIRGRLDRMRGDVGADRWSASQTADVMAHRDPPPPPAS